MALPRVRALTPLTRTLLPLSRTSLPASFTSLPLSSSASSTFSSSSSLVRPFTTSTPLQAASSSPSTPSSSSHDSHDSHSSGAHDGHHGHEDRSGPDYGLHFHEPSRWHKLGAQFFGGLLWFWLLYRAKNDWRNLFFWDNPFDSHDAPHAEGHDDAHHDTPAKDTKH